MGLASRVGLAAAALVFRALGASQRLRVVGDDPFAAESRSSSRFGTAGSIWGLRPTGIAGSSFRPAGPARETA